MPIRAFHFWKTGPPTTFAWKEEDYSGLTKTSRKRWGASENSSTRSGLSGGFRGHYNYGGAQKVLKEPVVSGPFSRYRTFNILYRSAGCRNTGLWPFRMNRLCRIILPTTGSATRRILSTPIGQGRDHCLQITLTRIHFCLY